MKIRKVEANNRKSEFQLVTDSGDRYVFPYARSAPRPDTADRVADIDVAPGGSKRTFTYVLQSGDAGSVHLDQVLQYNAEPTQLRDHLLQQLTREARQRADRSGLSRRELARRLDTSLPQLYRLLDETNTRKSMNQLVALLEVLDCDVELVVRDRGEATWSRTR